jgi:hypothetical protein
MGSFHEPVRSAVIPTAGSGSGSLPEGTPGGTPGKPAGEDARATTMPPRIAFVPDGRQPGRNSEVLREHYRKAARSRSGTGIACAQVVGAKERAACGKNEHGIVLDYFV